MNVQTLDIVLVIFFSISILVGIYRGFVKEVLSLGSWLLAGLVAFRFGEQVSVYIKPYVPQEPLDLAIAYVAVFIVALILFSIISHLISQIFASSGMGGIDRSLGSVFGAIRAGVIVAILIGVGTFMSMNEHEWWTSSQFLPYFEPLLEWMKTFLPEAIVKKIEA